MFIFGNRHSGDTLMFLDAAIQSPLIGYEYRV
jgi:hypothetical protein